MANTFEEASKNTEEMFANEQQSILPDEAPEEQEPETQAEPQTEPQTETEPEPQPEAEQNADISQAAQTAEIAAEVAKQKDDELKRVISEMEALKKQNQQLQGTIDELSKTNEEKIIEEALTPPTLDINGLAFADADTQKEEMAKYAEAMTAYNRQQLMKELSPALEYAKKGMRDEERKEVISALSNIPELANIESMLPQLDRVIANNKWLQSDEMPMDEKYINAYAIAKGVESINKKDEPKKEMTAEDMLNLYNSNPAFKELVEKQRLEEIKQGQQVPPFTASSGAVNAALNIKDKPQTLEEAFKRTREMVGEM